MLGSVVGAEVLIAVRRTAGEKGFFVFGKRGVFGLVLELFQLVCEFWVGLVASLGKNAVFVWGEGLLGFLRSGKAVADPS